MVRYVLEGEWSGYKSSQRRIVHRDVVDKWMAERIKELAAIVYTDGTRLDLYVREAKPRERVQKINGYGSLIRQAVNRGGSYVRVADL